MGAAICEAIKSGLGHMLWRALCFIFNVMKTYKSNNETKNVIIFKSLFHAMLLLELSNCPCLLCDTQGNFGVELAGTSSGLCDHSLDRVQMMGG